MHRNFFEELENSIDKNEDFESLFDEILDKVDNPEIRASVKKDATTFFDEVREKPARMYKINDLIEGNINTVLESVGTSKEEFELYWNKSARRDSFDASIVIESLEQWGTLLFLLTILDKKPSEEINSTIDTIFRSALDKDEKRVENVLSRKFDYNKAVNGYKRAFSNLDDSPTDKMLADKLEIIEKLYESLYKPQIIFIANLISIAQENNSVSYYRDAKTRFIDSNIDNSLFLDGEIHHIRNSSAHEDYTLDGDTVQVRDRDWDKVFTSEELNVKIQQICNLIENTLLSLSYSHNSYVNKKLEAEFDKRAEK